MVRSISLGKNNEERIRDFHKCGDWYKGNSTSSKKIWESCGFKVKDHTCSSTKPIYTYVWSSERELNMWEWSIVRKIVFTSKKANEYIYTKVRAAWKSIVNADVGMNEHRMMQKCNYDNKAGRKNWKSVDIRLRKTTKMGKINREDPKN